MDALSRTSVRKKHGKTQSLNDDLNGVDQKLGNEEKSVCHHCAKILDMYKTRYRTITFPNSEERASLTGLKFQKRALWSQSDVEYLVALYKHGDKRQQRIFGEIDAMEKKISTRALKERIIERHTGLKQNITRKTEACKRRESVNQDLKKQIDFDNTVAKASELQMTHRQENLTQK